MKTSLGAALVLQFGFLLSLKAQNIADPDASSFDKNRLPTGVSGTKLDLPVIKAQAFVNESPAVFAAQDVSTLEPRLVNRSVQDSVVDVSVLEKSSPFRSIAAGFGDEITETQVDGVKKDLAQISAAYRESGRRENDCQKLSLSVEQRVKLESSELLEIVEREVKYNPACACEIVKAAIQATEADADLVVSILEVAIIASPESMRVASQCAIASVPESIVGVQALLSQFDANAGESGKSAKSSKGAKVAAVNADENVAAIPNPLDFPGQGPVGPPGGGQPYFKPVPPVVTTRPVTEVSP